MTEHDGWNELTGVARVERADGPTMDGEGIGLYWRLTADKLYPSLTRAESVIRECEVRVDCGNPLWEFILGDIRTWADPTPYVRFDVTTYLDGQPWLWTFPVFRAVSATRDGILLLDRDAEYLWRVARLPGDSADRLTAPA